jgi:integrase
MKQGRLSRVPYVSLLTEDNARQGFFERADFEAVVDHLEDPLDDFARFGYLTGWRRGEIAGLRWEMVDRSAKEVRLPTSKNGSGRVLPLEGELWDLVERRWSAREVAVSDDVTKLSEFVFHRKGHPVAEFRKSWTRACKQAKVPGLLFHDLRRTAVRNMVRAGVPQSVAMSISGHKTVSMFMRYNITSEEDKRKALKSTQKYVRRQSAVRRVVSMEARTGTN